MIAQGSPLTFVPCATTSEKPDGFECEIDTERSNSRYNVCKKYCKASDDENEVCALKDDVPLFYKVKGQDGYSGREEELPRDSVGTYCRTGCKVVTHPLGKICDVNSNDVRLVIRTPSCSSIQFSEGVTGGEDDGCDEKKIMRASETCTLRCIDGYTSNDEEPTLKCPTTGGTMETSFQCTKSETRDDNEESGHEPEDVSSAENLTPSRETPSMPSAQESEIPSTHVSSTSMISGSNDPCGDHCGERGGRNAPLVQVQVISSPCACCGLVDCACSCDGHAQSILGSVPSLSSSSSITADDLRNLRSSIRAMTAQLEREHSTSAALKPGDG